MSELRDAIFERVYGEHWFALPSSVIDWIMEEEK